MRFFSQLLEIKMNTNIVIVISGKGMKDRVRRLPLGVHDAIQISVDESLTHKRP